MATTDFSGSVVNLISAGSRFEGTVEFSQYTRFEGYLEGKLRGTEGSTLVLGENGFVEGLVDGDQIIIDGFVRGEIKAKTSVVVSETGRVVGQIISPSIAIKFGGFFDGQCFMKEPKE